MSESSQFASCLIALTSSAKLELQSIEQCLILKFFSLVAYGGHLFGDASSNDPKSQEVTVF